MGQTRGLGRTRRFRVWGAPGWPVPTTWLVGTPLGGASPSGVQTDRAAPSGRPGRSRVRLTLRFAAIELGIWGVLYGAYLAIRGVAISDAGAALSNAAHLIHLEKASGLFHEAWLQRALGALDHFFSTYYMLGFGPLVLATLLWLGLRQPAAYRRLRTALLVSIAVASILYIVLPTAPPRLVEGLGIADTVGLSSHDTGSFAGIRFNPYAAMPSMHVGWSLLIAVYGYQSARRPLFRLLFAIHPLLMGLAVTATGNHFFVDSLAGAGLAAATLLAIHLFHRRAPQGGGPVRARIVRVFRAAAIRSEVARSR
jgi:PAP2 superfamily